MYVKFDEAGRIAACSETHHCGKEEETIEKPEGFTMENASEWVKHGKKLVHSPAAKVDAPDPKVEYAALKNATERIAYIAKRLGLGE